MVFRIAACFLAVASSQAFRFRLKHELNQNLRTNISSFSSPQQALEPAAVEQASAEAPAATSTGTHGVPVTAQAAERKVIRKVDPLPEHVPFLKGEGWGNTAGLAAANNYGCTGMNISDGVRCGQEMLEDALRCGWRPCVIFGQPTHCPNVCLVNLTCEVAAICRFKARVEFTGMAEHETFRDFGIDFGYVGHHITHGEQVIRTFLNTATNNVIVRGILNDVIATQQRVVQEKIDEGKEKIMELLTVELGRDDIWGDYGVVQEFLGNSSELVERLVPTAGFEAFTHTEADSPIEGESLTSALKIPEAATWAQARFCFTVSQGQYYWVRILPFAILAALTAIKFPRVALVIAVAGVALSTTDFMAQGCDALAPNVIGNTNTSFAIPIPQEGIEFGAPAMLGFRTSFHDATLRVDVEPVSMATIQTMLDNLIDLAIDLLAELNLPARPAGYWFNLQANEHTFEIAEGTYADVEMDLDFRCFPNCPGCKIINCGNR